MFRKGKKNISTLDSITDVRTKYIIYKGGGLAFNNSAWLCDKWEQSMRIQERVELHVCINFIKFEQIDVKITANVNFFPFFVQFGKG